MNFGERLAGAAPRILAYSALGAGSFFLAEKALEPLPDSTLPPATIEVPGAVRTRAQVDNVSSCFRVEVQPDDSLSVTGYFDSNWCNRDVAELLGKPALEGTETPQQLFDGVRAADAEARQTIEQSREDGITYEQVGAGVFAMGILVGGKLVELIFFREEEDSEFDAERGSADGTGAGTGDKPIKLDYDPADHDIVTGRAAGKQRDQNRDQRNAEYDSWAKNRADSDERAWQTAWGNASGPEPNNPSVGGVTRSPVVDFMLRRLRR